MKHCAVMVIKKPARSSFEEDDDDVEHDVEESLLRKFAPRSSTTKFNIPFTSINLLVMLANVIAASLIYSSHSKIIPPNKTEYGTLRAPHTSLD